MEDARQALVKVESTITTAQLQHWDPHQPVQLLILCSPSMPMGALWQLQGVLEWLHLGHSPAKFLCHIMSW
jgi:bifunctional pyridoxal-dependent enzyme with beta-cystathionase and maltose regulon repressor activities